MKEMIIYHNNSSVSTIKDLVEYKHIIETDDFTYKTFFDENRTRIFQQLSDEYRCELAEKKYGGDASMDDLKESDLDYEMKLPFPCTLLIKAEYVTTNLAISETNFQVDNNDFFVFENEQIQKILTNPQYIINRSTKKQKPEIRVFGWFKSYYYTGTLNKTQTLYHSVEKHFIELSKYIQNISTSVNQSGGTFTITLPMVKAVEKVDSDGFTFSKADGIYETIKKYIGEESNSVEFENMFFHKSTVRDFDKTLFNWMIQNNDLLFISFGDDLRSMEEDIGMRCFDMICLVDEVSVSQNSNGNGNITISGRDLMKLITDDSSLFFNKSTAWGGSNIFTNTESYEKSGDILSSDMFGGNATPVDRLRRYSSNEINIFAYPDKTLDFIIKGVVQKLVNIEIVPDYVFEGWGDRRTRFNELEFKTVTGGEGGSGNNAGSSSDEPQKDEELNINLNVNANKRPNRERRNPFDRGRGVEDGNGGTYKPIESLPATIDDNASGGWIKLDGWEHLMQ